MSTRRWFLARSAGAAGGLFLVSRAAFAQSATQNVAPNAPQNNEFVLAKIDDDIVLKAMRDEMDRSRQLRVSHKRHQRPVIIQQQRPSPRPMARPVQNRPNPDIPSQNSPRVADPGPLQISSKVAGTIRILVSSSIRFPAQR